MSAMCDRCDSMRARKRAAGPHKPGTPGAVPGPATLTPEVLDFMREHYPATYVLAMRRLRLDAGEPALLPAPSHGAGRDVRTTIANERGAETAGAAGVQ